MIELDDSSTEDEGADEHENADRDKQESRDGRRAKASGGKASVGASFAGRPTSRKTSPGISAEAGTGAPLSITATVSPGPSAPRAETQAESKPSSLSALPDRAQLERERLARQAQAMAARAAAAGSAGSNAHATSGSTAVGGTKRKAGPARIAGMADVVGSSSNSDSDSDPDPDPARKAKEERPAAPSKKARLGSTSRASSASAAAGPSRDGAHAGASRGAKSAGADAGERFWDGEMRSTYSSAATDGEPDFKLEDIIGDVSRGDALGRVAISAHPLPIPQKSEITMLVAASFHWGLDFIAQNFPDPATTPTVLIMHPTDESVNGKFDKKQVSLFGGERIHAKMPGAAVCYAFLPGQPGPGWGCQHQKFLQVGVRLDLWRMELTIQRADLLSGREDATGDYLCKSGRV